MLANLETQRNNLAANLATQGVESSNTETLSQLVPKVLSISSGVDGNGVTYDSFDVDGNLTSATIYGTVVPDRCFFLASQLTSVSMSETVTIIGSSAFYNCSSLYISSLPTSLLVIGNYAFYQSDNGGGFESLPSTLFTIGSNAFCMSRFVDLTSLPDGLSSIGESAFSTCEGVNITTLPYGITTVPSVCFAATDIAEMALPSSIISIGTNAFTLAPLRKVWIPNSVTTITCGSTNPPFESVPSTCVIFCEAPSKPAGWSAYWNYHLPSSQLTVNWGATKAQYDAY
jgi:hypothetical protein